MKKIVIALLELITIIAVISSCSISIKAADFSDKFELYESWNEDLKEYTKEVSREFDIPYSALISIIYHESRFNPDVGTKYIGLMQVGSTTDVLNFLKNNGLDISKNDLYNPYINIRAGAMILRYAIDNSDNIEDAFYIYTCGESAVKYRKENGLSKNNATVEIYSLYLDYYEYFDEQEKTEYKELLLKELEIYQNSKKEIESLIAECNEYELEYYNQKLYLIDQNINFIVSSLDSLP